MPRLVEIVVDGEPLRVPADATLAAALVGSGRWVFRRSVRGEPRGPICGMGICFECALTVNGIAHTRACLEPITPGLEVVTGG